MQSGSQPGAGLSAAGWISTAWRRAIMPPASAEYQWSSGRAA